MDNYIWAVIVAVLFLFSLWRMKVEYHRGFRDGATKVLGEWKSYMGENTYENQETYRD